MDRSESRNRIRIAVLLFLVMAGFYWKLTRTRQFEWMSGPDLAEQVLPWFQQQAIEWHAGRLPLWDPYLWAGQPLFGQAQPGAAYPLNWILFLLPLENGHIAGWALAWYYVTIHLMAAAFCYLFCRSLGRSRTASLAGGLIFSLTGFLGNTPWPQMMNGAVWIPLVFLFQLRAARSPRPAGARIEFGRRQSAGGRRPGILSPRGSHGGPAAARANLRRAGHRPTRRTRARPPRHPRRNGLRRHGDPLRYLLPRLARAPITSRRRYEVNGAMRGVPVPRGTHTLTMRYRPISVFLGAALSLAGILGALGWAAFALPSLGRPFRQHAQEH